MFLYMPQPENGLFFPILFFFFFNLTLIPSQTNNSLSCRPSEIVNGFVGWLRTLLLHQRLLKYHAFPDLKIPHLKC